MKELLLIGIGSGNPDHVTLEAIRAMREADVILIPRKGADKADLADLRRQIVDVHLGPDAPVVEFDLPTRDGKAEYFDAVDRWHDAIALAWQAAAPTGAKLVALLIWGDPSLYDSSLRIAGRLAPPKLQVVPGITSLQVLTAAHGIALNEIGAPVVITTGRQLRERGWPKDADTVAVMLDGSCSFTTIDTEGVEIWWGAYVGMPQQILMHGPVSEIADQIIAKRAEARAQHGWIMDIYLLRRR
ncbi:MAG: precorrin-6A synthase (deacetylating) [Paracoccaceae bacterium]